MNESIPIKFKNIDMKLIVIMTDILESISDISSDLYLDINRKINRYIRTEADLITMMNGSFKTRNRVGMVVSLECLIKLQYQDPSN